MASLSTDKKGNWIIQFVGMERKRRSIRLGKVPMKLVNEVKLKVEDLAAAKAHGLPIPMETARWIAGISDELAAKLNAVGLIQARASATLDSFIAGYIEGRTDVKPCTRIGMEQGRQRLVAFFDASRDLRSITRAEVDGWMIWLKGKYAEATAARTLKRARQFFHAARRAKLIDDNPLDGIKPGRMDNPDKMFFVDEELTRKVLDACPHAEWRAFVALARYGGLRCPSETLALMWGDIDRERNRFLVRSSKLEHCADKGRRFVPLFPELRPHLEALFDAAPEGSVYVINRTRDGGVNLRSQLERIIYKAGEIPWPRLFQNMRASRETELAARFPLHVVTKWIGNSATIAAKHYLQLADADFNLAAGVPAVQKAVQQAAEANTLNGTDVQIASPQSRLIPRNTATDRYCSDIHVIRVGLEPSQESSANAAHSESRAAKSGAVSDDAALWSQKSRMRFPFAFNGSKWS